MQARKLPSEGQAETVTRNIFSHRAAMEALEDVLSRRAWDGAAGVADREDRPVPLFATGNANTGGGTIIFSRVLEQILEDKSHVMFLTSDLHGGTIAFNFGIHTIGQRAQVVHLSLQEVREVHGAEGDL